MSTAGNRTTQLFLEKFAYSVAIAVLILAILQLVGWFLNITAFNQPDSNFPALAPSTALCIMFLAGSLLILQQADELAARILVGLLSLLVSSFGFLMFLSYFSGPAAEINHDLFNELGLVRWSELKSSPLTSVYLMLTGISLFLLSTHHFVIVSAGQWLSLAQALSLIAIFLSYSRQQPLFFSFDHKIGISILTATEMSLLTWALLFTRTKGQLSELLRRKTYGGSLARWIVVVTIIVPIVLAWAPNLVNFTGISGSEFGILIATILIIIVLLTTLNLAWRYDHQAAKRHSAELQAQQLQADVTHLARVHSLGEMSSGIAHELNQPLTAISNCVATCRNINDREMQNPRIAELMTHAQQQVERILSVIKTMRSMVQKKPPEKHSVDLPQLIRQMQQFMQLEFERKQVQLELELPPDLLELYVDPVQIQQVIFNLLQNALDAVQSQPPEERKVVLGASVAGRNTVRIEVLDSGGGFAEGEKEKIFYPFVSSKGDGGIGIGLPLCRSIVEMHGGKIWAESPPAGGALILFTLPSKQT